MAEVLEKYQVSEALDLISIRLDQDSGSRDSSEYGSPPPSGDHSDNDSGLFRALEQEHGIDTDEGMLGSSR